MNLRILITTPVAVLLAAPLAFAQPKVTQTIAAPYVPDGLELRQTEDCHIQSLGGAPDARLRCSPGYGWRLHDAATGAVVYPHEGYMRSDLEWAFAGPGAVAFLEGRRLFTVDLRSGKTSELGSGDLEQFRDAEALGFSAVVWTLPLQDEAEQAMILMRDGTLSAPIEGADLRRAKGTKGLDCRPAVVLAALGAENFANARWSRIVRKSAGVDGQDLCRTVRLDRLAGLGADGRWRPLDPANFGAIGTDSFASVEEALGQ